MKIKMSSTIAITTILTLILYTYNLRIGAYFSIVALASIVLYLFKTGIDKNLLMFFNSITIMGFLVLDTIVRGKWYVTTTVCLGMTAAVIFLIRKSPVFLNYDYYIILNIVCFVEVLGGYFQFFFPRIYQRLASFLFTQATFDEIVLRQQQGYINGFTREVAHYASFIVLGIGINLIRRYKANKLRLKTKDIDLYVLFYVFALFICGKRSHLLFSVISFFLVLYIIDKSPGKIKTTFKAIGIAFLVTLVLVLFWNKLLTVPSIQRYLYQIESFFKLGDFNIILTGRLPLYEEAIRLWKSNALFGIGWGNFKVDYYNISPLKIAYDVHNIYLQLLCESGLVGFICFVSMFLTSLIRNIKLIHKIRKTDEIYEIVMFTLYYQLFFLLYGFTGTCLYEPTYYLPYYGSIFICECCYSNYMN